MFVGHDLNPIKCQHKYNKNGDRGEQKHDFQT